MEAYGQTGIPQAFIVGRDGKVLWVGSPLLGLEQAVEQEQETVPLADQVLEKVMEAQELAPELETEKIECA
jgi:hypothetical protein